MDHKLETVFLRALESNQQKLLRICSVYAKDDEDTKDLFQEVLINIWKSLPNFKGEASISTWMFRVTLNVCLRFRTKNDRKLKKVRRMDSITISNLKAESISDDTHEQLIRLRSCIKQLNEADRAVISLYLEELPYKDISRILGLTENTVAVKIKRVKAKLLNCIEQKK